MNIIDRVIKYGLYLVVFLTPLFFLPLTSLQLDPGNEEVKNKVEELAK